MTVQELWTIGNDAEPVVIQFPHPLLAESTEELAEYIQLFLKRMKRRVRT